jgi:BlaI family transcriptional regulator, penicillinase repressor
MLRTPPRPTEAELAILRVLWRRGPSTVRQVREVLELDRPTGYTTALKLLQIMFEKGLVLRDESSRTHVYHARALEQQTRRLLLRDLADRAFDGSLVELVKEAIATRPPTREEAAEIRQLLRPSDDPPAPRRSSPVPPTDDDTPGHGRLF